jgi:hypothetical protein
MGFLADLFGLSKPPALPTVTTIMPQAAVNEIMAGRLPQLNTKTIFLKSGEICHYIDKGILLKEKVQKRYARKGGGYSIPGFFKGTRIHLNKGQTDVQENVITEQFRGILYITNKRIIFQATANAFEKPHSGLTAAAPFSNAIELQYGSKSFSILVSDGNVAKAVLDLLH